MKFKSLAFVFLFLIACAHNPTSEYRNPAAQGGDHTLAADILPKLPATADEDLTIDPADVSKYKIPSAMKESLNKYFAFLGVDPKSDEGQPVLMRLLDSSTRFLACADFEDWECLEADPLLAPISSYRQDTAKDLGKKVYSGKSLNMQHFFTKQYDVDPKQRDPKEMLAQKLAAVVNSDTWDSISMALYGVDDIHATLKPFYDSLLNAKKKNTVLRAVFDAEGVEKVAQGPILFSHRGDVFNKQNFFTMLTNDVNGKPFFTPRTVGQFQYDDTPELLANLNEGAQTENDTNARIEWPVSPKIMHNKFLVFADKNKNLASVWTGTANVAQTCMGDESNANMAIYIQDTNIAKAYYGEFEEMFEFSGMDKSTKFAGTDKAGIPHGNFHEAKTPNTQRYFYYDDGTEVRVHFAPTDDGEHRAIIPALLSVRPGDQVRISMFGSAGGPGGGIQGMEVVRAIQYAIEKGAAVRIVFDNLTNAGASSWIYNKFGNIRNNNVYSDKPRGSFDFRVSAWGGLDHEKVATITRAMPDKTFLPETIIIGSQNWSTAGNDDNDENMITIRNRRNGVQAARDFNDEFDHHLWKAAQVLKPKAPKADSDATADATTKQKKQKP